MTTNKGQHVKVVEKEHRVPLATGGRVSAIIPQSIEEAYRLASAIASANMAPSSYDRSAEKILIGILHGMEVGLPPMAALQSIAIINNMPSIYGDGVLGLVRASGLLEEFKETLEGEGDARTAVCWVKRLGEEGLEREFSVADAKKALLWQKTDTWTKYPQRMLKMRARSWALRDGFTDILKGIKITEEVRDMGDVVEVGGGGSYVPEPQKADYEQADAGTPAEGSELDGEFRQGSTGYIGDEPEEEAGYKGTVRAENMKRETPTKSVSGRTTTPDTFLEKNGAVIIFGLDGVAIKSYAHPIEYFNKLKSLIGEADDPHALLELNQGGANIFVRKDDVNMKRYDSCMAKANEVASAEGE